MYFATNHAWSSYHHFYQGLARAFSETRAVLYVDPTVTGGAAATGIEQVADRVWVLRVRMPRGFSRRLLRPLRDRRLAAEVRRAVETVPELAGDLVVWTYTTDAAPFIRARKQCATSVYWTGDEVTDPFEPHLLRVVDHVFAVSPAAHEQKKALVGDRVRRMPMAIDPTPYMAAAQASDVPDDIQVLPRPLFGYGGAVGDRLDRDLLRRLAEATDGSVVLVGPVSDSVLQRNETDPLPSNVHFFGHREEHDAACYVAAFDVGLIPYTLTAFNIGSNPVKTYQYLAAGIPVVTTELPALEQIRDVVEIAGSVDEFVLCATELARSPKAGASERMRIAEGFSYSHLVAKVDAVLDAELPR